MPAKLLSPQTTDKFIEIMKESTPLLKLINFVKLNDPICSYPLLTLSRFKTRPVGRKEIAELKTVNDFTVNFSAKEVILPLLIPDSYIEDMNSSHEKVANYVAKVFAMDLQYLIVNGDKSVTGTDDKTTLQRVLDGVVAQINAADKTITTASDTTAMGKIKALVDKLEPTTLSDPDLQIWVGQQTYTQIWDDIATKSSKNSLFLKDGKIFYRGRLEVVEIPELDHIIAINPDHVIAGLCRDITLETQRHPEGRGNKVVVTARIDLQVVTEACLMTSGVNTATTTP